MPNAKIYDATKGAKAPAMHDASRPYVVVGPATAGARQPGRHRPGACPGEQGSRAGTHAIRRLLACAAGLLAASLLCAPNAAAETPPLCIAGVYGWGNLPVYVAVDRHLIEARAAAAGIPGLKITYNQ